MFTFTDWLLLWAAATVLLAGINWLYERHLRPVLAARFGWEPWTQDDHIPPAYFLGAFLFMSLFGFVAFAGAAVGL